MTIRASARSCDTRRGESIQPGTLRERFRHRGPHAQRISKSPPSCAYVDEDEVRAGIEPDAARRLLRSVHAAVVDDELTVDRQHRPVV